MFVLSSMTKVKDLMSLAFVESEKKMDIDFKITGLLMHKNASIVSRETITPLGLSSGNEHGRKDADIFELSSKSRSAMAFLALETTVTFKSFLTLTYPKKYPKDGKEVKRHLNLFLTKLRQRFENVDYLWFLEFQVKSRKAPHFHALLSIQTTAYNQHLIAKCWADTVKEDWQKVYNVHKGLYKDNRPALEAIKKQDGAKRYVLKYALKTYQKIVPKYYHNVGRFWGCSYNVRNSVSDFTEAILFPEDMSEDEKLKIINKKCGTTFPDFAPKIVFNR